MSEEEAREKLDVLILEAGEIEQKIADFSKPLNGRKEDIKKEIRKLYQSYPSLFEEHTGQTVKAGAGGTEVHVTQPKTPISVDWPGFIRTIGFEVFHECFVVTDADMIKPAWDRAVEEERVRESDLQEFMREGAVPKPTVRFHV